VRNDIAFRTADGLTLRGWHYPASNGTHEHPSAVIVMAHGFSGVKGSLTGYAEVFQAAGLAVLLFDHRCFGDSEGLPRQEIDPYCQLSDFRDAITFAQRLPGIDPERVGVWGTSFAGGHAIVLGATDRRVKCVVNQVALMSGSEVFRELFTPKQVKQARKLFAEDRRRRMAGETEMTIPVFSYDETALCALPFPIAKGHIEASEAEDPLWKNEVTLRSLENLTCYEPITFISKVAPTPLLMIVATNDGVAAATLGLAGFHEAHEPKRLVTHPGGHFTAYGAQFALTSGEARDWFVRHLAPRQ
jgi:uncharacterized protein